MEGLLYQKNDLKTRFGDFFRGKSLLKSLRERGGGTVKELEAILHKMLADTGEPIMTFPLALYLNDAFGQSNPTSRKHIANLLGYVTMEGYDDVTSTQFCEVARVALKVPDEKNLVIAGGRNGLSTRFANSSVLTVGEPDISDYIRENFKLGGLFEPRKARKCSVYYTPTFQVVG